jgi:Icc-related predicted phosphoesterase
MKVIKYNNQNILLLADTHGKHRLLSVPEDIHIVIHCGDICNDGNEEQIKDFFMWFSALRIPNKIFVHGNHDLPFELEPYHNQKLIPSNVFWLNNKAISIKGIVFCGINLIDYTMFQCAQKSIDFLISHYPPYGILDSGFGSKEISQFVTQTRPKYHVFGHNHDNPGQEKTKETICMNVSNYKELCQRENPLQGTT